MSRQPYIPENSAEAATLFRDSAQTFVQFAVAIAYLLFAHQNNNFTAEEIAGILGISRSTIFSYFKIFRTLDENSMANILSKPIIRNHAYFTLEEEEDLLNSFSPEFSQGQMITANKLHERMEAELGHPVNHSTPYRLLHRHDFRKVKPDTKHPKSDQKVQEKFKNDLPVLIGKSLQKNSMEKPVKVIFQDESRIGRINDQRSCWARSPFRPIVNRAVVRESRYAYGAIAPKTGKLDYMMADKMDTENMNKFLRQVSRSYRNDFVIMILDGAGSHKSKTLIVPNNMSLIYLPPYSPELNPIETLWNVLKRDRLANRYFDTLDAVIATATQGLSELKRNKAALKSQTLWAWLSPILNAI